MTGVLANAVRERAGLEVYIYTAPLSYATLGTSTLCNISRYSYKLYTIILLYIYHVLYDTSRMTLPSCLATSSLSTS